MQYSEFINFPLRLVLLLEVDGEVDELAVLHHQALNLILLQVGRRLVLEVDVDLGTPAERVAGLVPGDRERPVGPPATTTPTGRLRCSWRSPSRRRPRGTRSRTPRRTARLGSRPPPFASPRGSSRSRTLRWSPGCSPGRPSSSPRRCPAAAGPCSRGRKRCGFSAWPGHPPPARRARTGPGSGSCPGRRRRSR